MLLCCSPTFATSSYTMRPLLVLRVCTSLLDGFDVLHSTNAPFDGSAAVKGFSESEPWLVWYGVVWCSVVSGEWWAESVVGGRICSYLFVKLTMWLVWYGVLRCSDSVV